MKDPGPGCCERSSFYNVGWDHLSSHKRQVSFLLSFSVPYCGRAGFLLFHRTPPRDRA